MMLRDTTTAIDALTPIEFMARVADGSIAKLSIRTRAYAAVRWCILKYPNDRIIDHRDEAFARLGMRA